MAFGGILVLFVLFEILFVSIVKRQGKGRKMMPLDASGQGMDSICWERSIH